MSSGPPRPPTDDDSVWSPDFERAVSSFATGVRLVFGGAMGGVAFQVIRTGGSLSLEISLFCVLILMAIMVDYPLRGLEIDTEMEEVQARLEEIQETLDQEQEMQSDARQ